MAQQISAPSVSDSVFSSLSEVHGAETARVMVANGLSLAVLFDALRARPSNREAVRLATKVLLDEAFVVSPDLGPVWHIKYIYDGAFPLQVVDIAILTMDRGLISSTAVRVRMAARRELPQELWRPVSLPLRDNLQ